MCFVLRMTGVIDTDLEMVVEEEEEEEDGEGKRALKMSSLE